MSNSKDCENVFLNNLKKAYREYTPIVQEYYEQLEDQEILLCDKDEKGYSIKDEKGIRKFSTQGELNIKKWKNGKMIEIISVKQFLFIEDEKNTIEIDLLTKEILIPFIFED